MKLQGSRSLALWLLDLYQAHLSPRKGFRCAAGVLHAGPSCSDVVRNIVVEQGPFAGWEAILEQFRTCRAAGLVLAAQGAAPGEAGAEAPPEAGRREGEDEDGTTQKRCWDDGPDMLLLGMCTPDPSDCGLGLFGEGVCSCL